MKAKMIEIRDAGTFIPAVAFLLDPLDCTEPERYLMHRVGIAHRQFIGITNNISHLSEAHLDSYAWPKWPRTYRAAHQVFKAMVEDQGWDNLPDGVVVDVEFELGETTSRKVSERLDREGGPF